MRIFVSMETEYIDLLHLQLLLKEEIEGVLPGRIRVKAEISQLQARANGHCYLELSQSLDGQGVVAKARAVVWRNRWPMLSRCFKDETGSALSVGMSVLLSVQLSYSELYGLTLVVDDIDAAFTLGEAELQKRKTIQKLTEEGLIDKQKELTPSELPYRLAVISASDAAGFGDFSRHIAQNEYGFAFEVDLFPASMQGDAAPESISNALQEIEVAGGYDAALIIRGGGSALDLACFDDYSLCFAIACCPVPVYTAIGHDRDFHVADMVAYGYVKTPTALADLFIDEIAAEDELISSFGTRLKMAFGARISRMESELEMLASRIMNADPRNVLARGFSLAADAGGVVLKSATGVEVGDFITVCFHDGALECKVVGLK